jgi:acyl CoA:acetate/3-ketoacid CoA transferase
MDTPWRADSRNSYQGFNHERKKSMNNQDRVLSRRGARELTENEVDNVGGGIHTETACTVPTAACPNKDGDASIGECGPIC